MEHIQFLEITSESQVKYILDNSDYNFRHYLGFDDVVEYVYEDILNHDSTHKYWIIKIDNEIVGITYIYGYSYKYKKCSLGFGLLPSYRGNKQSTKIVNKFCDFLPQSYNIIRIQVDIEVENKTCIKWFDKHHNDMGFTYECDANNHWGEGVTVKIYSNCSTK